MLFFCYKYFGLFIIIMVISTKEIKALFAYFSNEVGITRKC